MSLLFSLTNNKGGIFMSKAVKLDHEFDIDKFTELLISAQGGRSQTKFANDCNLSVAYMCKILNKKFDKAPTPATIEKIAANAANDVTLEDLLNAAGYDPQKYSVFSPIALTEQNEYKKLAMTTIISSLSKEKIEWTITAQHQTNCDLCIQIKNNDISEWYFEFIYDPMFFSSKLSETDIAKQLYMYYAAILMDFDKPKCKYSFVTNSEVAFKKLIQFHPYMLAMYVSIILIDTSTLTIIEEKDLKTAINTDGESNLTCALM